MIIVRIDPFYLDEHPEHEPIFGPATVDPGFVESIRERGVLQPCIVTLQDGYAEDDPARRYWIIAGRRRVTGFMEAFGEPGQRWQASLDPEAGIPCYVKSYESEGALVVDLIVSNKHRNKTEKQLIDEVERLLSVYGPEALARQKKGLKRGNLPSGAAGPHGEEEGRVSRLIADHVGVSVSYVKRLRTVFSDSYQRDFIDELKSRKAKDEQVVACCSQWDEVRRSRLADEVSLSKAEQQILDLKDVYIGIASSRAAACPASTPKVGALRFKLISEYRWRSHRQTVYRAHLECGEVVISRDDNRIAVEIGDQAIVIDEVMIRTLHGPKPARAKA